MREGSVENRIVTSPGLPSWDCIDAVFAYGGMTGEFLPSEYTIRSFPRDVFDVPVFKIATLRFYTIGMTDATQRRDSHPPEPEKYNQKTQEDGSGNTIPHSK